MQKWYSIDQSIVGTGGTFGSSTIVKCTKLLLASKTPHGIILKRPGAHTCSIGLEALRCSPAFHLISTSNGKKNP